MDFVLDSSDSDSTHNSIGRSRLPLKPAIIKDEGRMNKADLMAAYAKLDTPKLNRNVTRQIESKLDASRERMKLTNVIDSETNGEDTESLFLMPITLDEPSNKDRDANRFINTKTSMRETNKSKDRVVTDFSMHNKSQSPIELELSGVSDAEELLAEFSEDTSYLRYANKSKPKANPLSQPTTTGYGRLLQVDSNSEHTTPKFKSIKDELDQSKTRFRQSINDLLNSSPISSVSIEKASVPRDFKEMVRMGSKLSETLIGEIEVLERRPNSEEVVSSNPIRPSTKHRKATTEELLAMSSDNPFESKPEVRPCAAAVEELPTLNMTLFIHRILWALLVVAIIFCADVIIQVMIARQQAGVPMFEGVQLCMDKFDEILFDLSQWLFTRLDDIIPH